MKNISVTKFSGKKEPYQRKKILRTCMRTGLSRNKAEKIVDKVESKLYDGITTKKILNMTLNLLEKEDTSYYSKYGLRQALSELRPDYHNFEKFVQSLFRLQGYDTKWDQIIQGKCIEHQIDVIASKEQTILIECKHHKNPHRFCGLGDILQNWARFMDIRDKTDKYQNICVLTNTKFSAHAMRFAKPKGMMLIGWGHPKNKGLETMIDRKSFYPVTALKISKKSKNILLKNGIIQIFQVIEEGDKLKKFFSKSTVNKMQRQAEKLCKNV